MQVWTMLINKQKQPTRNSLTLKVMFNFRERENQIEIREPEEFLS